MAIILFIAAVFAIVWRLTGRRKKEAARVAGREAFEMPEVCTFGLFEHEIHSFTHSFIQSFTCSIGRSFIRLFIH